MPRRKTPPVNGAKPGRPSLFTPELAERICALAASGESLMAICRMEGIPEYGTVRRWLGQAGPQFEAFRAEYARACELRAAHYAEEIVDISNDPTLDPQEKRVRIDARKWIACKLLPRQYGDSVTVKGDKENPLEVRSKRDLTDAELAAIAAGGLRDGD